MLQLVTKDFVVVHSGDGGLGAKALDGIDD